MPLPRCFDTPVLAPGALLRFTILHNNDLHSYHSHVTILPNKKKKKTNTQVKANPSYSVEGVETIVSVIEKKKP
jgi:hypothetical protein